MGYKLALFSVWCKKKYFWEWCSCAFCNNFLPAFNLRSVRCSGCSRNLLWTRTCSSGGRYSYWRTAYYPKRLPQEDMLWNKWCSFKITVIFGKDGLCWLKAPGLLSVCGGGHCHGALCALSGQGRELPGSSSKRSIWEGLWSPSSTECVADSSYTGKAVLGMKPACLGWWSGLDDFSRFVPTQMILNYMLWPLGVFNVREMLLCVWEMFVSQFWDFSVCPEPLLCWLVTPDCIGYTCVLLKVKCLTPKQN